MSEYNTGSTRRVGTHKSIADLVAEDHTLVEVAVALDMSVIEVLRWYTEMAALLHVRELPALAKRLRAMEYGSPVVAPWSREMFTVHTGIVPERTTSLAG